MKDTLARLFLRFSGYTYSNMARLFMRLFVGLMFMQFGIRQINQFQEMSAVFPSLMGMSSQTCLVLMIIVEIFCSALIMVGLCTRLSTIPPIVTMIIAEHYLVRDVLHTDTTMLNYMDVGYVPILFIGIYLFLLLAGPGKISLDYMISLRILANTGKNEEEEMEEV